MALSATPGGEYILRPHQKNVQRSSTPEAPRRYQWPSRSRPGFVAKSQCSAPPNGSASSPDYQVEISDRPSLRRVLSFTDHLWLRSFGHGVVALRLIPQRRI